MWHWCQRLGLWLARRGGWTPCTHPGMVHEAILKDLQAQIQRLLLDMTREHDAAQEARTHLDRLQAVMDATETRYRETVRGHEILAGQIQGLVEERDRARDDFNAYAQQRLEIRPELQVRAKYLVGVLAKKGGHLDGEFKRHQVYADLIKEFPQTRKRDLSLAIEMAVRAETR